MVPLRIVVDFMPKSAEEWGGVSGGVLRDWTANGLRYFCMKTKFLSEVVVFIVNVVIFILVLMLSKICIRPV